MPSCHLDPSGIKHAKEKRSQPYSWEQRKLGDLGSVQMNKRIFKDQTSESGEVPFFKIGTFGKKPDSFISKKLFDEYKSKYPYPKVGDILISASGSIGRTVFYKGEDAYFQDSNIVWLEHDGRLKNSFLEQFLKRTKWNKIEGSTIKRLYNKDILNKKINLPKLKEQEKIGQLFQYLDKTITLHEEKHRQLEQLKKALLQKMFADETGYPLLRFKGFTITWQQRKLGDLASFSKGSGYSKMDLTSEGIPVILYGRLYTGYETIIKSIDTFSQKKKSSVYSTGRDVIVPASGETAEDIARASVVSKKGVALGSDLNIITPTKNIDPTFLALSISNGTPHKEMAKRAQGKSIVHLHNADLVQIMLKYPSLREQKKVSQQFEKLDALITLHQHKIDNLKLLKRALLQKMFV